MFSFIKNLVCAILFFNKKVMNFKYISKNIDI